MTCATCRHWRLLHDERGQCVASLPVLKGTASSGAGGHSDYADAVWPITRADDFCAHHKPDGLTRAEAAEHVQAVREARRPHEAMVCGEITMRKGGLEL